MLVIRSLKKFVRKKNRSLRRKGKLKLKKKPNTFSRLKPKRSKRRKFWLTNDASMLGGQVLVETYGSGGRSKNVRIENTTFDTSFGPHVKIVVGNSCEVHNLVITGNQGFNNDAVPAATYPCIEVAAPASGGGYIRGSSIVSNGFSSSFADDSKGTYTGLVQQTGAGTVGMRAVTVIGNSANNCAVGYLGSFTPNHSSGNVVVPYSSGTTTTF